MNSAHPKLIVVSNRLPLSFKMEGDKVSASPSSGGLVSALAPILAEYGGTWIGSTGAASTSRKQDAEVRRVLTKTARKQSYQYWPIFLSEEEQVNFYEGFSNEIVWPLFHDLQSRCNFLPQYWKVYQEVNGRFADAILKSSRPQDTIWIQDYQLMDVARQFRRTRPKARLAFFMHIPFPAPDIFEKLPWRRQILEALLQHDLVGLQTQRDERNLISCLRAFVPDVQIGATADGRSVAHKGRTSHVQFFPISIDYKQFASLAASSAVEKRSAEIRGHLKNVHITLGVDRLDYTKGIPERLRAFATLLRDYPKLRNRISLYQVVVPSRETISGYQRLKGEVERLVTRINGEYSVLGWTPVHYVHRSLPREELLGLYRAADSALVTPLKDGMNLVSKEYCAAQVHNEGVLILSEFAGAAPELRTGALLVNPYDELGVAAAINRAFNMERPERQQRMRRIRTQIRKHDILHWRDSFFDSLKTAV
ncbi:MAG: alpha,alpha-trehalose-phosphate synthase (UDP-forming) [Acidobacteriaceae bacterium]